MTENTNNQDVVATANNANANANTQNINADTNTQNANTQNANPYLNNAQDNSYQNNAQANPYLNNASNNAQNNANNTQNNDSILSSLNPFSNLNSADFLKGALIGAAAAYLLTNENAQKSIFKAFNKGSQLFQAGVEELKERYEDAKAESNS